MLNICVVGTGYVGLVTGTCLAELGHSVCCVDADSRKIERLGAGEVSIYEPGLDELVAVGVAAGRLTFTTDLGSAVRSPTLVLVIAVGTPTREDRESADLRGVMGAVEAAARLRQESGVEGFVVFTIKSTVPVGTCRAIEALVALHLPLDSFAVVSNPEFLREGSAVTDFMEPDRIVIGSTSAEGSALMRRLYAPLTTQGFRLFEASSTESSEMIKYASNVFLATKIGLINEFSRLCERTGADVEELARGIALDRRIGPANLRAGPGFGGSCFPKDLRAVVADAARLGLPMSIAEAVISSNERQKTYVVDKVVEALGWTLRSRRIAVLGLSFKAGTDDVREAPALSLIASLLAGGAEIAIYDPVATLDAGLRSPGVVYAASMMEAVFDVHAVVVVTEWPVFRLFDWRSLVRTGRSPLIIDLRNCLDREALTEMGLQYIGLGRGNRTRKHPSPQTSLLSTADLID